MPPANKTSLALTENQWYLPINIVFGETTRPEIAEGKTVLFLLFTKTGHVWPWTAETELFSRPFLLSAYGDLIVKLLPASALEPFDAVYRSALRFVNALGLGIAYCSRRLRGSH